MNIRVTSVIFTALGVMLIIATMLYDNSAKNRQAYYTCLETQKHIAASNSFKDRQIVSLPDCRK